MEPTLRVAIVAKPLGHMLVQVELTPDNVTQKHWFEFEADQTHVGNLVGQLRLLLQRYPVRGNIEQTT
jgi:hypothetical protein